MEIEFLKDRDIYKRVILEMVSSARKFLWIATADLKDLYVNRGAGMVPFLEILAGLMKKGVLVRLIHAKEPGPRFRTDFDRYPELITMERMLCPRTHFKSVIADGRVAYSGSANLTGAGMGAKSDNRRNFESGILTMDPKLVKAIMDQFDSVWMGTFCAPCDRHEYCTEYDDIVRLKKS